MLIEGSFRVLVEAGGYFPLRIVLSAWPANVKRPSGTLRQPIFMKPSPTSRRGRPPLTRASSHDAIMNAVYALLQEKSVRDLTIEEVAKRAKVGKPTIYRWWPTKATLVLAMLCERMAPNLETPTDLTAEESLRFRVRRLIDAFNGPFGRIVGGLIAEGQSEPAVLQEYFDRWVNPRRNATIADLRRGKSSGELRPET